MNKMFIKFNFTYVSMQSFIMIGPDWPNNKELSKNLKESP